jgi:hypothetical protein
VYLHLQPEGTSLTEAQAKTLDDEFFLAHPLTYFASRIAMLLEAEGGSAPAPADHRDFFSALGLSDESGVLGFNERERGLQMAVDALALRHQAAEALARFVYAVAASKPRDGNATSIWLAVADSPTRLVDVVTANKAALEADAEIPVFIRHFYRAGTRIDDNANTAAGTAVAWYNHAVNLLTNDELSTNSANNKAKHGLAISTRDDVRIEFTTTPPSASGEIPLSAFGEGNSIPIIDRPMLTYLTRSFAARPRQGLEAVALRVDIPVVLAEAWMMANVYAALFHVAAGKHFGEDLPEAVAPYPTLVFNRLPEHVIGPGALGYRSAVTSPPDGVSDPRPSGLFFYGHFLPIQLDIDSKIDAVVVDG